MPDECFDDPFEREIAECLAAMAEVLAAPREMTPTLVAAWATVLRQAGVQPEEVRPTAMRLLSSATFFPTPAQFLEALRPADDADAAEELAWQRALGAVRRFGGWASIELADVDGDPAILWVLARMGWERICRELDEEKRAIWRSEFLRVYRLAQGTGAAVLYLAGRCEADNLSKGRTLTPALVGRPDWAELPASRTEMALGGPKQLAPVGALLAAVDP